MREHDRGVKTRRKPARGGEAVGTVAGAPPRKRSKGALVDGRRSGSGKPLALTRGRQKRSRRSVEARRRAEAGRGMGRQRLHRRLCSRPRKPWQGSAACARGSSPPQETKEGRRRKKLKLERRRQARFHLGSGRRKAVWRSSPDGLGVILRAHRGGGHQGASRGLRNRAIFGCSYRMSVAEVGERHLPGAVKVSREAIRGGAG